MTLFPTYCFVIYGLIWASDSVILKARETDRERGRSLVSIPWRYLPTPRGGRSPSRSERDSHSFSRSLRRLRALLIAFLLSGFNGPSNCWENEATLTTVPQKCKKEAGKDDSGTRAETKKDAFSEKDEMEEVRAWKGERTESGNGSKHITLRRRKGHYDCLTRKLYKFNVSGDACKVL